MYFSIIGFNKKKYIISLFDIVLFLYFYFNIVANHTIYSDITTMLVLLCAGLICISKSNVSFSFYFILELLFILYCIYQNEAGITVYNSVANAMIKTLIICIVFNVAIFNIMMQYKDITKIAKILVYATLCAVFTLLIVGRASLLNGRFLSGIDMSFIGVKIAPIAVTIAASASLAFVFNVYLYLGKSNIKCFIISIPLLLCILLSGTRKALLICLAAFVFIVFVNQPKKIFRNLILICAFAVIVYYLVMKVPMFYNIIGYRFDGLVEYMQTGDSDESSVVTRMTLIENGIKYIKNRPITGYGIDNYRPVLNSRYYSHNNFIEMLFSGGIVGFCIYYSRYLFLILSYIKDFFKCKKYKYKIDKFMVYMFLIFILYIANEYGSIVYYERMSLFIQIFLMAYIYKLRINRKYKGVEVNL